MDKRGLERREREVEEENAEKNVKDRGFLSRSLNFFLSRSRNPDRKGSPVGAAWLSCGVRGREGREKDRIAGSEQRET